jgi:hypothetical protein
LEHSIDLSQWDDIIQLYFAMNKFPFQSNRPLSNSFSRLYDSVQLFVCISLRLHVQCVCVYVILSISVHRFVYLFLHLKPAHSSETKPSMSFPPFNYFDSYCPIFAFHFWMHFSLSFKNVIHIKSTAFCFKLVDQHLLEWKWTNSVVFSIFVSMKKIIFVN